MTDQIVGAVIMWVIGSLVFLVPVILIAVNLLQPQKLSRSSLLHADARHRSTCTSTRGPWSTTLWLAPFTSTYENTQNIECADSAFSC